MSEVDRFNEAIRKNARFWAGTEDFEDILNFQPAYTPAAIHAAAPFTEAMKSVSEPEPEPKTKEAKVRARLVGEHTGTCYMCARKGQFLSRLRDDNRIICEDCAYEHLT